MSDDITIVRDPEFNYCRYLHLSADQEYDINFNDWHRLVRVEKELANEEHYSLEEAKFVFQKLWGYKKYDRARTSIA
jgi:hypothetical protein